MKEKAKKRLIDHIAFLQGELEDYARFKQLSWEDYRFDKSKQREVERWIERLVNSSIDISKIILACEGIRLPDTYKEIVRSLSQVPGFDATEAKGLSRWVRLRNVIAHEYLDIKWTAIKRFISETEPLYKGFLNKAREYLNKGLPEVK